MAGAAAAGPPSSKSNKSPPGCEADNIWQLLWTKDDWPHVRYLSYMFLASQNSNFVAVTCCYYHLVNQTYQTYRHGMIWWDIWWGCLNMFLKRFKMICFTGFTFHCVSSGKSPLLKLGVTARLRPDIHSVVPRAPQARRGRPAGRWDLTCRSKGGVQREHVCN